MCNPYNHGCWIIIFSDCDAYLEERGKKDYFNEVHVLIIWYDSLLLNKYISLYCLNKFVYDLNISFKKEWKEMKRKTALVLAVFMVEEGEAWRMLNI